MTKHFAYGSNLWFKQMDARCSDNEQIDKGKLKDYRWIISSRGYANIVESKGDYVLGYVYEISSTDEGNLDGYEGVSSGAYTKEYLTIEVSGEKYDCLVYIDRNNVDDDDVNPKKRACSVGCECTYTDRINNGVKDSLSDEDGYVEKYIRKFIDAD
tara:strand:- start:332 stop:799 length:468 start_codon:yes stop_codon:yes gene_type:complete